MGKLTAARLENLSEPGRYSDGDGLFLVVKRWVVETGFFERCATASGATLALGRSSPSILVTHARRRTQSAVGRWYAAKAMASRAAPQ